MDRLIGIITGLVILLVLVFLLAHFLCLLLGRSQTGRRVWRSGILGVGHGGDDAGVLLTLILGASRILDGLGDRSRRRAPRGDGSVSDPPTVTEPW